MTPATVDAAPLSSLDDWEEDLKRRYPEAQSEALDGLDKVELSWGHDEYLYHVVKDYLPEEALNMIRYHSCYPIHKEGEYSHLLSEKDREMFRWVNAFNPYDLYSKGLERPNVAELRPYYEELIAEFFPPVLKW